MTKDELRKALYEAFLAAAKGMTKAQLRSLSWFGRNHSSTERKIG